MALPGRQLQAAVVAAAALMPQSSMRRFRRAMSFRYRLVPQAAGREARAISGSRTHRRPRSFSLAAAAMASTRALAQAPAAVLAAISQIPSAARNSPEVTVADRLDRQAPAVARPVQTAQAQPVQQPM